MHIFQLFFIINFLNDLIFNNYDYSNLLQNNSINNKILRLYDRELPKSYIEKAINFFKQKNGKTIVELGSLRFPINHDLDTEVCDFCMDGHSTLFWVRTNAEVYTVDIDSQTFEQTKEICKNFKNVIPILQDGIEFLKKFEKPIDLLYLDAWNAIPDTDYAEKHLEAYEAAKKNLHTNSMILIDDTDIYESGKGKLVIPRALQDGYKIIFQGRQTLLMKES